MGELQSRRTATRPPNWTVTLPKEVTVGVLIIMNDFWEISEFHHSLSM